MNTFIQMTGLAVMVFLVMVFVEDGWGKALILANMITIMITMGRDCEQSLESLNKILDNIIKEM